MKRYEAGASQPTLDVIRKLSQALRVSADERLFGKAQRGPDEDLRLQFEAISRFNDDKKGRQQRARRFAADPRGAPIAGGPGSFGRH
jgi:hypothetical protein